MQSSQIPWVPSCILPSVEWRLSPSYPKALGFRAQRRMLFFPSFDCEQHKQNCDKYLGLSSVTQMLVADSSCAACIAPQMRFLASPTAHQEGSRVRRRLWEGSSQTWVVSCVRPWRGGGEHHAALTLGWPLLLACSFHLLCSLTDGGRGQNKAKEQKLEMGAQQASPC